MFLAWEKILVPTGVSRHTVLSVEASQWMVILVMHGLKRQDRQLGGFRTYLPDFLLLVLEIFSQQQ